MLTLAPEKRAILEHIGRMTTDEYFHKISTGEIEEGAPYELLNGILVLKDRSKQGEPLMSIGGAHARMVNRISRLDRKLDGRGCYFQTQSPVRIPPLHAPEPDGSFVKGTCDDYPDLPPSADFVSCVVEVADSSLRHDRTDKCQTYAEAGIPQFVIINLVDHVLEINERPDPATKTYLDSRIVKAGEHVQFLLPDGSRLDVAVEELLP